MRKQNLPALAAVQFEHLEPRTLFSTAESVALPPPVGSAPDRAHLSSLLGLLPAKPTLVASAVPANGDNNPYGVTIISNTFATGGALKAGDVLVSYFNDKAGLQGTGTTIVSIAPNGRQTTFFQGPKGLGLTTALGVLQSGFVLVGNVPAPDGTHVNGSGSMLVLDKNSKIVASLTDLALLDGPWDLTIEDQGTKASVFVSNVLNGTVTRLRLSLDAHTDSVRVISEATIASGYTFRTDPAALVIGPTGLAFDRTTGELFVASTGDNAIYEIPDASVRTTQVTKGTLVYQDSSHLRGPLGLTFAGDNLITANGDAVNADPTGQQNSELVEFTLNGEFVDQFQIDPTLGGAFGLAFAQFHYQTSFAAVNDVTNTLDEWILP